MNIDWEMLQKNQVVLFLQYFLSLRAFLIVLASANSSIYVVTITDVCIYIHLAHGMVEEILHKFLESF